ncbi:hypothetical protein, conserved [Trypanosoma brucei brucei TREU927]|uniref:Uncharacterized protein n=1 Tax=Trypanosoma brucei brucei (strain 927/4 GUTat10.1) TaxID=185431 RepID=Q57V99_TRYB2|nr:hypothetical protein, conserved [Trypanosoma brucei brucei TREU927]AAX70425.1 hypothetical protein, conserved [Trypanosoma brucei]AAZ11279.1 hypothetical protein, conserved [Trypanosoma brucei brucei TREU927]
MRPNSMLPNIPRDVSPHVVANNKTSPRNTPHHPALAGVGGLPSTLVVTSGEELTEESKTYTPIITALRERVANLEEALLTASRCLELAKSVDENNDSSTRNAGVHQQYFCVDEEPSQNGGNELISTRDVNLTATWPQKLPSWSHGEKFQKYRKDITSWFGCNEKLVVDSSPATEMDGSEEVVVVPCGGNGGASTSWKVPTSSNLHVEPVIVIDVTGFVMAKREAEASASAGRTGNEELKDDLTVIIRELNEENERLREETAEVVVKLSEENKKLKEETSEVVVKLSEENERLREETAEVIYKLSEENKKLKEESSELARRVEERVKQRQDESAQVPWDLTDEEGTILGRPPAMWPPLSAAIQEDQCREAQLATLQNNLKNAESKLSVLQQERDAALSASSDAEKSLASLRKDNAALRAEGVRLRSEMEKAKDLISQLETGLSSWSSKERELQRLRILMRFSELKKDSDRLPDVLGQVQQLEEERGRWLEEKRRFRDMIERYQRRLEELECECNVLKEGKAVYVEAEKNAGSSPVGPSPGVSSSCDSMSGGRAPAERTSDSGQPPSEGSSSSVSTVQILEVKPQHRPQRPATAMVGEKRLSGSAALNLRRLQSVTERPRSSRPVLSINKIYTAAANASTNRSPRLRKLLNDVTSSRKKRRSTTY